MNTIKIITKDPMTKEIKVVGTLTPVDASGEMFKYTAKSTEMYCWVEQTKKGINVEMALFGTYPKCFIPNTRLIFSED